MFEFYCTKKKNFQMQCFEKLHITKYLPVQAKQCGHTIYGVGVRVKG